MELKWTSKALSDLARLYDFLVLASKPAVTNGAIVIHTQRLKSDPGGNLLS
ncbi:hypothetical protein N7B79_004359 [Escherichia coli]|nr:hypothetical protein [Escherichia coli]